MDWVKIFYNLQYSLFPNLSKEDLEYQKDKIALIQKFGIESPSKILELGGGFGAFSLLASKNNYNTTMIDIVESACNVANDYKRINNIKNIHIICDDFYNIKDENVYDSICYWDGFGIGTDVEQKELLSIINKALKNDALLFLDIYNPAYWSKIIKKEMSFESAFREYDYDFKNNKMIDCWWEDNKDNKKCQRLSCYSPETLEKLIEHLNFEIIEYIPSGYMNYNDFTYHKTSDINKSMSYTAILKKND